MTSVRFCRNGCPGPDCRGGRSPDRLESIWKLIGKLGPMKQLRAIAVNVKHKQLSKRFPGWREEG